MAEVHGGEEALHHLQQRRCTHQPVVPMSHENRVFCTLIHPTRAAGLLEPVFLWKVWGLGQVEGGVRGHAGALRRAVNTVINTRRRDPRPVHKRYGTKVYPFVCGQIVH